MTTWSDGGLLILHGPCMLVRRWLIQVTLHIRSRMFNFKLMACHVSDVGIFTHELKFKLMKFHTACVERPCKPTQAHDSCFSFAAGFGI